MEKGAIDLETSNVYYDPDTVPQQDKYYMPVQCQQCRQVALHQGLPGARRHGRKPTAWWWWTTTGASAAATAWPPARTTPAASTTRSRRFPRRRSTRTRATSATASGRRAWWRNAPSACTARAQGKYPACLEVCPTGARVFGNLLDPDSEISYILNNKRVYILKEEVGHPAALLLLLRQMKGYLTFLFRVWRLSFQGSGSSTPGCRC